MKCEKCESCWESKIHMNKCPFCGASLSDKDGFAGILSEIIDENGYSILKDRRVIALIKDLAGGLGYNDEIKLLGIVVENRIGEFISQSISSSDQWDIINCKARKMLEDREFIDSTKAEQIINIIGQALGYSIIEVKEKTNVEKKESNTSEIYQTGYVKAEGYNLGQGYSIGNVSWTVVKVTKWEAVLLSDTFLGKMGAQKAIEYTNKRLEGIIHFNDEVDISDIRLLKASELRELGKISAKLRNDVVNMCSRNKLGWWLEKEKHSVNKYRHPAVNKWGEISENWFDSYTMLGFRPALVLKF